MRIRPYDPETDLEALKEMHSQQGFDYLFRDPSESVFVSTLIVEDEGRPVMAIQSKKTIEAYLLMLPKAGTPKQRLDWFLALHQASEKDLVEKGFEDVTAYIPNTEPMSKFRRLLRCLGWVDAVEWSPMTKPWLTPRPDIPMWLQRLIGRGMERPKLLSGELEGG